jgi:DUF1009 family protein
MMNELLISNGLHSKRVPTLSQESDIKKGFKILNQLSSFDIGQALVIENGTVLGIEAIEGTKELIHRCHFYRENDNNKTKILIKGAKMNQDLRIDLPSIGKDTFLDLVKFNYLGIAVLAQKTQILHKDECVKIVNGNNMIFVALQES